MFSSFFFFQCFGSGFNQVSGPTQIEKIKKFHVLKFWMCSFAGQFCTLDVLYVLEFCFFQCFGSGLNQVSGSVSGSGSRRAKMTDKNIKKYEISCFEVLNVLFCGLKAPSVPWTSYIRA
jgi:hypothetical protein